MYKFSTTTLSIFLQFFDRFFRTNPSLPYFYGLPKTHKPDVPLRPIISSCNSVNHPLARWLASTLSPFVGTFSDAHVSQSTDFLDKVRNLPTCDAELLSFDVNALFTNVPLNDVLEFLERKLADRSDDLPIPADRLMDLIRLYVSNNVFSFGNNFYRQVNGIAMGSPLAPALANLYSIWKCLRLNCYLLFYPLGKLVTVNQGYMSRFSSFNWGLSVLSTPIQLIMGQKDSNSRHGRS